MALEGDSARPNKRVHRHLAEAEGNTFLLRRTTV